MPANLELNEASRKNIEIMIQMEQQLLEWQSRSEQFGEAIVGFFGSDRFVALHIACVAAWVACNSFACINPLRFDPHPFPLLSLLVGLEFILLTTFVIMNQKYEVRRSGRWTHFQLQLSMLVAQEQTKGLRLIQSLCRHFHLDDSVVDQETKDLSETTRVAEEIERAREGMDHSRV